MCESHPLPSGVDALPGGREQPFYRVLVDVRDRPFQLTYVAQCNVELLTAPLSQEVINPEVGRSFEGFDGERYVPNAYLRQRFPEDYVLSNG